MKTIEWVEGALLLALGLIGIVEGLRLAGNVDPDAITDILGPGYYILSLGFILIITSIGYVLSCSISNDNVEKKELGREHIKSKASKTVFYMVFVLIAYLCLINILGYFIPTIFFLFLEFKLVGVKTWKKNFILSVLITLVFYLIFIKYCRMVFPTGIVFG